MLQSLIVTDKSHLLCVTIENKEWNLGWYDQYQQNVFFHVFIKM